MYSQGGFQVNKSSLSIASHHDRTVILGLNAVKVVNTTQANVYLTGPLALDSSSSHFLLLVRVVIKRVLFLALQISTTFFCKFLGLSSSLI